MTNLEKYDKLFMSQMHLTKEELPGLQYNRHKYWDSLGHMDLMTSMEETFGIQLSTLDVLEFSTYELGKEVLAKYGVEI